MSKMPPRSFQDEGQGGMGLGTRIAYSARSNAWGLIFWGLVVLYFFTH